MNCGSSDVRGKFELDELRQSAASGCGGSRSHARHNWSAPKGDDLDSLIERIRSYNADRAAEAVLKRLRSSTSSSATAAG
jgi:hypothetical protein